RTFDFGECRDSYYLTMEFVDGESLSHLLARHGHLRHEECVDIGSQICKGLATAHEAGVIHRDLKPDNILIEKGGRVVISDFGIARQTKRTNALKTAAGAFVGTPAYMAPEQFTNAGKIDARADLYALGAILFEMFTGSRAWVGDNLLVLATARITSPPPDPRERRKDLDVAVVGLLQRCMAKDPHDRYPDANALLQALHTLHPDTANFTLSPITPLHGTTPNLPHHINTPTPTQKRLIAVLPFRNEGCKDDIYLIEGVCEDLIDTLSTIETCKVRSWREVHTLQHEELTPEEIGKQLGVQYIITGSFRRVGESVQLRVRLTSCTDGFQLWGKRFKCTTAELFDLVDDITAGLSDALAMEQPEPQNQYHTQDPVAIDLYFRAKHLLREQWHHDVGIAVEYFDKARERAPNDPLILSGASVARARQAFYHGDNDPQIIASSRVLAEQALAIAPERSEALFALGMVCHLENKKGNALKWLRKAIEVSPTHADAHDLLGRILQELGDVKEAIEHLKLAYSLDPNITSAKWDLIRAYALLEEWDAMAFAMSHTFEGQDPEITLLTQYRLSLWKGELRPLPAPETFVRPIVASGIQRYQALAEGNSMESLLEDTAIPLDDVPSRIAVLFYQQSAELCAYFDRDEQCFALINKALETGLTDLNWLKSCPVFHRYKENETYKTLLSQMETRAQTLLTTTI
ncbi:MAG TPA: hypothetical protein DCE42_13405, partial [Myxococcales bacterium]|nr:hypothetical protein [Myxococcales bacterium]